MEENTNGTSDLENICGLWHQKSKTGTTYYKGKGQDGTIYKLFKNTNKKSENSPDLNLCRVKTQPIAPVAPKPTQVEDDDIPF